MKRKSLIEEYEDIAAAAPVGAGVLFGLFMFACLIIFSGLFIVAKEYTWPFILNLFQ